MSCLRLPVQRFGVGDYQAAPAPTSLPASMPQTQVSPQASPQAQGAAISKALKNYLIATGKIPAPPPPPPPPPPQDGILKLVVIGVLSSIGVAMVVGKGRS